MYAHGQPGYSSDARSDHLRSAGSYNSPMTIKMNLELTALLALVLVLTLGSSNLCLAERLIQLPDDIHKALARPGSLPSVNGRCKAKLQVSAEGGFLVLSVTSPTARSAEVSDITGIAWIGSEMLIYTVSPVYGKPGLFLLDCHTMQTTRVISPRSIGVSYPDGADYFSSRESLDRAATGSSIITALMETLRTFAYFVRLKISVLSISEICCTSRPAIRVAGFVTRRCRVGRIIKRGSDPMGTMLSAVPTSRGGARDDAGAGWSQVIGGTTPTS